MFLYARCAILVHGVEPQYQNVDQLNDHRFHFGCCSLARALKYSLGVLVRVLLYSLLIGIVDTRKSSKGTQSVPSEEKKKATVTLWYIDTSKSNYVVTMQMSSSGKETVYKHCSSNNCMCLVVVGLEPLFLLVTIPISI